MSLNYNDYAVDTSPSSSIAGGDSSISVSDNTAWPDPPFLLDAFEGGNSPNDAVKQGGTVERMLVTAESGSGPYTWDVTRDYNDHNGSGQSFTTSATVRHVKGSEQMQRGEALAFSPKTIGNIGAQLPIADSFQSRSLASQDQLVVVPYPVFRTFTWDSIDFRVTEAGSADGTWSLAIYDSDEDGQPNNLMRSNSFAVDTTGPKSWNGVSLTTSPGLYWFGAHATGMTTLPKVHGLRNTSQVSLFHSATTAQSESPRFPAKPGVTSLPDPFSWNESNSTGAKGIPHCRLLAV